MYPSLAVEKPPGFLKLLGNELRWQLLKALSDTDLRVQELVRLLDRPQNLVSYHLKKLEEYDLVREHRSLADGREIYYSLDLDRVRAMYVSSGEALHPALGHENEAGELAAGLPPVRVLFLCTHNSARSQMAEALLRTRSQGRVAAFSAGTEPSQIHPLAVRAMAEMNIDIQEQRSKSLQQYIDEDFDFIITVCDRAREACPVFPGDPEQIHWSFEDPSTVEGSEQERFQVFRQTALQLNNRIGYLLLMIQRNRKKRN